MSFIHPKSEVDPKAKIGKNCYIAAFACIRADEGEIEIGEGTSIQESCVVHGEGVKIGKNVTVGHGAIVHGCVVSDNVLVGMNAVIMDRCEIGRWSIVAAGAVVTEGTKVPAGYVVAGVPAKIIKQVDEEMRQKIAAAAENYIEKLKKMGKYE
ncbi:Carbonic anhydrase [uncultured archaeon]|nr:Carbonic anhydrase [uncultured archaeon]